jgi:hypothetical protein
LDRTYWNQEAKGWLIDHNALEKQEKTWNLSLIDNNKRYKAAGFVQQIPIDFYDLK